MQTNDCIKITVAIFALLTACLYYLDANGDMNITIEQNAISPTVNIVIGQNDPIYTGFIDKNKYYIIDYNKNLIEVNKETYERLIKNDRYQ